MKIYVGLALLTFALSISQAAAHDWATNSREIGDNAKSMAWRPENALCSNIVNGSRSSFTQRLTQFVEEDQSSIRIQMFGEHCLQSNCLNGGKGVTTQAPDCDSTAARDLAQDQFFNIGVPAATYEAGEPRAGAMSNFDRKCGNQLIDYDLDFEKDCAQKGCPDEPQKRFDDGDYVMGMRWNFLNQGDYVFYNCADFNVARAAGQLNASLGAVILANLFWLLPVALLPVVGAAVYARRHKAESMRASMAAGARMSAVTAAPATGYRSGFTAKNSQGSRMSGTTAAPATPYKSGFSGMNSQGRNSGVTAAPATPYKSGLTGAADLASANTASTGKSYSSGYTGLSDE